jgi:hypothetical protein
MVSMSSALEPDLIRSFEHASATLIDRIRGAINRYHVAAKEQRADGQARSTPQAWERRVLPNLENSHRHVQAAVDLYRQGDITRLAQEAGAYAGLSKDLDGYQMDWMVEDDRRAVEEAITDMVLVADRIHRLGYEELERISRT